MAWVLYNSGDVNGLAYDKSSSESLSELLARQINANEQILLELKLLNARVEAAFETSINENDVRIS